MELWKILVIMISVFIGFIGAVFGGMWAIIHYIEKQFKDVEDLRYLDEDDD